MTTWIIILAISAPFVAGYLRLEWLGRKDLLMTAEVLFWLGFVLPPLWLGSFAIWLCGLFAARLEDAYDDA